MKVLYLDCFAGISGDMFISSLIDAGLDPKLLRNELDKLHLNKQLKIEFKRVKYNSISAVQFTVKEKEKERGLHEILNIIDGSSMDADIKEQAVKMFKKIHAAEKKIHREFHHFHELGLLDTIIDVVGAILGLRLLKIEKVFASKINAGTGFVNTRHGKMPVPCPAALELLKGMPVYSDGTEFELVTPTGALILSEFVDDFSMPVITVKSIGYGAGTKKIENFPNMLRVIIGETESVSRSKNNLPSKKILIETNIDDMNPEIYEHVMDKLFRDGARDVSMTPIYMKKNRPGIMLSCICDETTKDKIIKTILRETTTIGLRIHYPDRIEMTREKIKVNTEHGEIEVKVSRYNSDIINIAPEYESCKKAANKSNAPLKDIYNIALAQARKKIY